MGHFHNNVLKLIQDTKLFVSDLEETLLVSPEDADYFRKLYKKKAPEPKVEIPLPIPIPERPLAPPVLSEPPIEKIAAPEIVPKPKVTAPAPVKSTPEKIDLPKAVVPKGLKELLKRLAPELAILNDIPSDEMAKKINTRWKTKNQTAPITLICYQENPDQKALLEQISKALDVTFGPARLVNGESIEKEKQWEALLSVPELKLIVCCDYTLWQLPGLMQFYKEVPTHQSRKLKDTPLFLLPDLSLYLKDPLLKRSLWKGLCQTLSI